MSNRAIPDRFSPLEGFVDIITGTRAFDSTCFRIPAKFGAVDNWGHSALTG